MKKSDLQVGKHGVVSRDGDRYIVVFSEYGKAPFLLGDKGYTGLDGYMDNLRHSEHSMLDIVRVFTLRESSMKFQQVVEDKVWQEDDKQACESQIAAAESKIGLHEYKIECLKEEIISLKERLIK